MMFFKFHKPPESPIPPLPPNLLFGQENEQKRELKLIERILEFNVGFSLLLGGILLTLLILVFAWKFDFGNYFAQKSPPSKNAEAGPVPTEPVKLAANSLPPLFITNQVIDIKKAYNPKAPRAHLIVTGQLKKEVFGFLPYWMIDKADQLNIDLLTAVSYFGLEVDSDGNFVKNNLESEAAGPWLQWQNNPKLDQFIKKVKKNRAKVYVTVKAFSNDNIIKLVQSKEASENFIRNALYLMNSKSIDGINIDFEYVGTPERRIIDDFSILMANLNKELKRQYPKAVLTIDTYITAASTTQLHDIPMLAANSDALVIMGYDFHTPHSSITGPVAPLDGYGYSLVGLMSSYLEKAPPEKLILAVPYYGYDWPTGDNVQNSPVIGDVGDVKALAYADIMEATKNTKINWDENGQTPWYSYKDPRSGSLRVVHFENTRSLGVKYDLINQKNLAGVGIWALGLDGQNIELWQLIADKFAH